MRKIRGHIRNLSDGGYPDANSVIVHAWFYPASGEREELNLTAHDLGYLNVEHQTGGSGAFDRADASGHFGWDMELSPGPLRQEINPTLPFPPQFRWRMPDESAQVGKAYHSDLERLGWTAGRDCLVWGAIEGTAPATPTAWGGGDPTKSSLVGDWSIGLDGNVAGRVLLRRGIGFLGGVVFSIEHADLLVPILSEPAASPNSTSKERWDLLILAMDVLATSATYGKQSILIQEGGTDGKIPDLKQVAGQRRMAIHALKMESNKAGYTAATDLRPWNKPPSLNVPGLAPTTWRNYRNGAMDDFDISLQESMLNNEMANDEIILPLDSAWTGMAIYTCNLVLWSGGLQALFRCRTEGRSTAGGAIADNSDFIVSPTPPGWYTTPNTAAANDWNQVCLPWPIRRIPSGAEGRTWHRLRLGMKLVTGGGGLYAYEQTMAVNLWPVP